MYIWKYAPTQLTYSNPNPLYPFVINVKHAYVLTVVSNILMKIPCWIQIMELKMQKYLQKGLALKWRYIVLCVRIQIVKLKMSDRKW